MFLTHLCVLCVLCSIDSSWFGFREEASNGLVYADGPISGRTQPWQMLVYHASGLMLLFEYSHFIIIICFSFSGWREAIGLWASYLWVMFTWVYSVTLTIMSLTESDSFSDLWSLCIFVYYYSSMKLKSHGTYIGFVFKRPWLEITNGTRTLILVWGSPTLFCVRCQISTSV